VVYIPTFPQQANDSSLSCTSNAIMVRITSVVALLASLPLLLASPTDIFGRDDNGRGGCDTVPTEEDLAAIAQAASLDFPNLGSARIATSFAPPSAADLASFGSITVSTWVHVVAVSENLIDGWIPDSQIYAQMDELNANFGKFSAANFFSKTNIS